MSCSFVDILALIVSLLYFALYFKFRDLTRLSSDSKYKSDNRRILYTMIPLCVQYVSKLTQLVYLTSLAVKLGHHRDRMQNLIRDTL